MARDTGRQDDLELRMSPLLSLTVMPSRMTFAVQ